MSPATLTPDLLLGAVAGVALGALHMAWLWRAARRLTAPGGRAGALLGGAVLRLAVLVAGFAAVALLATDPAVALVAALAGFVVLRSLALRRARRPEG
jgi:F1F0 ATPase subunit 2